MPYYPKSEIGQKYKVETIEFKIVIDYAKISYLDILDLDYYTFCLLLRDAFIYNCQSTKDGQEYLENAWIFEQKRPDRSELRSHFKK